MDRIINWFILIIIFVFDPLAISLVIAANLAFKKLKHPEPEQKLAIYNEKPIEPFSTPEEPISPLDPNQAPPSAPLIPPPPQNKSFFNFVPPIFKRKKEDDDTKIY